MLNLFHDELTNVAAASSMSAVLYHTNQKVECLHGPSTKVLEGCFVPRHTPVKRTLANKV